MKKKNLTSLKLRKKTISNLQVNSRIGGREVSIRETNCDYCPADQGPSQDDGGDDGGGGGGGTHTCTTFRTIFSCVIC